MALEEVMLNMKYERQGLYAFLMSIFFCFLGILSARMVFASNVDMMALAFTSLLLIYGLNKITTEEEELEARESKLSIKGLFGEHRDVVKIYIGIFFGIFFVYLFFSMFASTDTTLSNARSQLAMAGITGHATESLAGQATEQGFFSSVLKNNIKVLFACVLLSIIYGSGAVLFIAWNASVWGAVFGYSVKMSSLVSGQSMLTTFLVIMIPVFPHIFAEALSYFSASISGGVLSKAIVKEDIGSDRFNHVFTDSMIFTGIAFFLIVIAAVMETYLPDLIGSILV